MSMLTLHALDEDADRIRIALSGELDISSALTFEEQLRRIEDSRRPATIVLDLSRLKFMDSTGVRLILSAHTRALRDGWRLQIVAGTEVVRRIFSLTGLTTRLDIVDAVPAHA
jgi:anti-sigma B factor antagonist